MRLTDAIKLIQTGNEINVKFKKRNTGEVREMLCKTVPPKGTEPAYSFKDKELIPVIDVQVNQYRSIPLEGIFEIQIMGVWIPVDQPSYDFNTDVLRQDIVKSYGPAGAHVELFDMLVARSSDMELHGKQLLKIIHDKLGADAVPADAITVFNSRLGSKQ